MHPQNKLIMGKGDRRTFKGKIFKGSFGNSRNRKALKKKNVFVVTTAKKPKPIPVVETPALEEVMETAPVMEAEMPVVENETVQTEVAEAPKAKKAKAPRKAAPKKEKPVKPAKEKKPAAEKKKAKPDSKKAK